MKKKIIAVIVLLTMLLGFIIYYYKTPQKTSYKVLKVKEADLLYIDLNKNNRIDDNELIKLADVSAFRPIKNDFSTNWSKKLNLSIEQYLKTGYLARNWAIAALEGQDVSLDIDRIEYSKDKKYGYSYITFKNQDYGIMLLKNGLGFSYKNSKNKNYYIYQNLPQVKNNSKELDKLSFVLFNSSSGIIHKLDCEFVNSIKNAELILKKDALVHHTPCKVCFLSEKIINEYSIPKSIGKYPRSVYKKDGFIEMYLINPLELKKPNPNCDTLVCKRLVEEINSSNSTIDMALYGVGDQKAVIEALRMAKKRGVVIRAVVDYSKNQDSTYPKTKEFSEEFSAVVDKTSSLMHNKFFIFDNKKVITGSTNLSSTGTGGYNANIFLVINSGIIANTYKQEFDQMFNSKFSIKKIENKIGQDKWVKAYFSPKNDVYNNLIQNKIKNANKEIFLSIFYLTDKNLINELILAKKRGVEVLVLLDALCANNFKNNVKLLREAKIPVIVENWGGKNHEKTMVIDSNFLISGSLNFSKSGFYKNDENILLIENKVLASYYRDYYLYLFSSIDKKFLKLIPRAEGFDSKNSCYDGIDNNFDGKIDSEDDGCKVQKPNK